MDKNAADRARRERNAGRTLAAGAALAVTGIALGFVGAAPLAGPLTVVAFVLLLAGLHRYGRLGADPPL